MLILCIIIIKKMRKATKIEKKKLKLNVAELDNKNAQFWEYIKEFDIIEMNKRFAQLCKRKNGTILSQPLTMEELEHARKCIIKMEQLTAFRVEIWTLRENRVIPSGSGLRQLNPLLDRDSLLCGGKLRHAELPYNTKHPLVLPHHSKLTDLIILYEHIRHFHAGADLGGDSTVMMAS